jgi:biopolymer transport protein ExbD
MDVASSGNSSVVSTPNIVPLIDVLLVLIIIFMVITPRIPTGLPALLPQPSPPSAAAESSTIVVQVLHGDMIKINDEASSWGALGPRLSTVFSLRADKVAFVSSSADISFDQVARAIDIMRGAGVERVGLITPNVAASR